MIFGGIIIGFVKGWLFSIIILGMAPFIMICMALFVKYELKGIKVFKDSYARAGGVSDESFTFIRNVKALTGEPHQF